MKRLFICSVLLIAAYFSYSQTPVVMWHKTFGGLAGDYGNFIWPTSDGGFIATGYAGGWGGDVIGYHGNPGLNDYWVLKLDANGRLQWKKSLGGTFSDAATKV